jgi:magnesium-transporting ATPase (P-type)
MSENINPYESTQTDLDEKKPEVSQGFFTDPMIEHLQAASPWIKFMGVMSYISAGICILMGIIFVLFRFFGEDFDISEIFFSGVVNSTLGVLYLVMGIVLLFPAKYLSTFAAKIKLFVQTKQEQDMEIALSNNKSFWKFYGIWIIVSLALIPVIFIVAIVLAVVGSVM